MRRLPHILIVCAGLMGAAGVALAAMAAHSAAGGNLLTAAQFLLFHAPAVLGAAIASLTTRAVRTFAGAGVFLAAGAILFSGDLALRAQFDVRLFAMAAPLGGSLLILAWLMLAGAGLVGAIRPMERDR